MVKNLSRKVMRIKEPQKRAKFISQNKKKISSIFSPVKESFPCFVMGQQRSGTSMLMHMFHLHKNVEVYDESAANEVFIKHRLRDLETINRYINISKFNVVVFKPLADSHNISYYLSKLNNLKIIWCIRDYRDVANSYLRKFSRPNHAIRKVFEGKPGGGWFQEGVSSETLNMLKKLEYSRLTDFDLACLVWWARNRLYLENALWNNTNCLLLSYEHFVTQTSIQCQRIIEFLGIDYYPDIHKFIHTGSLKKNTYPSLNKDVQILCDHLYSDIMNNFFENKSYL